MHHNNMQRTRWSYHNFVAKLKPLLEMVDELAGVIESHLVIYSYTSLAAEKWLFSFIRALMPFSMQIRLDQLQIKTGFNDLYLLESICCPMTLRQRFKLPPSSICFSSGKVNIWIHLFTYSCEHRNKQKLGIPTLHLPTWCICCFPSLKGITIGSNFPR